MPVFIESYTALIVLCAIFGFAFSSSFSFIPVIVVELVDLDDFACAYGLVLLVQGVALLIGPPIAGVICKSRHRTSKWHLLFGNLPADDYTHQWDESFYTAGIFILVSGILAWVTGCLVDNEEDSDDEDNATESAEQK